jgi:hypothetical protein
MGWRPAPSKPKWGWRSHFPFSVRECPCLPCVCVCVCLYIHTYTHTHIWNPLNNTFQMCPYKNTKRFSKTKTLFKKSTNHTLSDANCKVEVIHVWSRVLCSSKSVEALGTLLIASRIYLHTNHQALKFFEQSKESEENACLVYYFSTKILICYLSQTSLA